MVKTTDFGAEAATVEQDGAGDAAVLDDQIVDLALDDRSRLGCARIAACMACL